MLTSLPGAAITSVKISGLKHQFGTIKGVKEDGVDLLLNLKQVRLAYEGDKPVKLTLSAKGKGTVTAGQVKAPAQVKIANPDLEIATLANGASRLEVEMEAEAGVGYSPAEERKTGTVGLIPLDADFSPVKRVNFRIEETRVGRLTNYDKLTLEVWTDGTVKADEVLRRAAEILVGFFQQVVSPAAPKKQAQDGAEPLPRLIGGLSVEELGLPTRVSNALVKAGFETVGDLVKAGEAELSKVRNLGGKSVKIVRAALKEKGVELA